MFYRGRYQLVFTVTFNFVWQLSDTLVMRKRVFGHMRTAKAMINLRISAVRSRLSLSATKIVEYYRMHEWRAKARVILCACAGWSLRIFAHVRKHVFAEVAYITIMFLFTWAEKAINPSPAEPRYALPLEAAYIQISWLRRSQLIRTCTVCHQVCEFISTILIK